MQCRSVEERIQELLDERLDPACDPELIEHAEMCAECQEVLDAQGSLFDGLSSLTIPSLPPDFSQRVVGTVIVRQRPARRFAPAAAFLAIIATLLLVFALGPDRQGIRPADEEQALAAASLIGANDGEAMGLSMADFDSREFRFAVEHFVAQLTSSEGARFQVDQLAGTIRPLASTLNVAFDAIRRTIPVRRHPDHSEPQARDLLRDPWSFRVS